MKWVADLCQMEIRIEISQHLDFILMIWAQHIKDPTPGLHLKTQNQITDYEVFSPHCLSSPGLERYSLFLTNER